jgi:signal transduction histidine kinase
VYPAEVQPLVSDLNALLDHRDQTIARAQSTAGDLAHGLKTPLAVLSHEADQAASAGHHDLAAIIQQQVDKMRRQVDYHLAHARVAASGATPGARCSVLESAEALVRTMRRLHAARGVEIEIRVEASQFVRVQREDLDEILGNLLDNACKWAKSRVALQSVETNGRIAITVDDDGPGLPETMWEAVLQRGVRVDEGAPGSGLGLAIVRDYAELYGGSIALDVAPWVGWGAVDVGGCSGPKAHMDPRGAADCVPGGRRTLGTGRQPAPTPRSCRLGLPADPAASGGHAGAPPRPASPREIDPSLTATTHDEAEV